MRNKKLRQEIKVRKYNRRLKLYGYDKLPPNILAASNSNTLRTTSNPCNCWMCKGESYKRAVKYKSTLHNLLTEIKQTA